MTTEQKAKAYDEALEKAKKYMNNGYIVLMPDLFPEFRESEDERIRKWLIAEMQRFHDAANKEGCWEDLNMTEKAISYLEKQKEQKPQTFEEPYNPDDYEVVVEGNATSLKRKDQKPVDYEHEMWKNCEANFEGGKKEVIEHPEKYGLQKEQKPSIDQLKSMMLQYLQEAANEKNDSDIEADTDKWARKILGYDFEQKPAEKQDYSGLTDLERAIHRGFLSAGVENVPVTIIKETAQECLEQMKSAEINEYEVIKKHITEDSLSSEVNKRLTDCGWYVTDENPIEWSENDEEKLDSIFGILHCVGNFNFDSWIKSLPKRFNLQLKQEWSEEDKEMLDSTIKFVEHSAFSTIGKGKNNVLAWLKSIRPQPKVKLTLLDENIIKAAVAFVEQNDHFNCWGGIDKHTVIKALHSLKPHWKPSEEQIEALKDVAYGTYQNGDGPALRSLYDDLKKLGVKEEPEYYQHFDPDC